MKTGYVYHRARLPPPLSSPRFGPTPPASSFSGPSFPSVCSRDVSEVPYTAGGVGGYPPPLDSLPFQCLRPTAKFCFGAFGAKRISTSKSPPLRRGP